MTKYLINRIIRALISVVIVVGVIMLMVYTFLDKQSVFAADPVYTVHTAQECLRAFCGVVVIQGLQPGKTQLRIMGTDDTV